MAAFLGPWGTFTRPVRRMVIIALLAVGAAKAEQCVVAEPPDLFRLDLLSQVTSRFEAPDYQVTLTSHYVQGRLATLERHAVNSAGPFHSVKTYTYNRQGQRESITTNAQGFRETPVTWTLTYQYDAAGRLTGYVSPAVDNYVFHPVVTCISSGAEILEQAQPADALPGHALRYLLNAQGQVTEMHRLPQHPNDQSRDITRYTYQNGIIERIVDTSYDAERVTFVGTRFYNALGMVIRDTRVFFSQDGDKEFEVVSTFEYVVDEHGNWTECREYEEQDGKRTLVSTTKRTLVYKQ
ncbi:RHS repeat protein [Deinococcus aquaedulcis]|uniref:RHS repeat protein n=1 Tax=Deinococcus aquaedulcis TaxID=2840455 RepID=UPI001C83ACD3|nr:RHS repeat protein [Deinococcus aquaedulcis]